MTHTVTATIMTRYAKKNVMFVSACLVGLLVSCGYRNVTVITLRTYILPLFKNQIFKRLIIFWTETRKYSELTSFRLYSSVPSFTPLLIHIVISFSFLSSQPCCEMTKYWASLCSASSGLLFGRNSVRIWRGIPATMTELIVFLSLSSKY